MDHTLDPPDWSETEEVLQEAVRLVIARLRGLRDEPAWRSPSSAARARVQEEVPWQGSPLAEVFAQFREAIWPYPTGNVHPRFWGWVMGNGTHAGLLADLLISGMNCHVSGYDQGAAVVERQVLRWLGELMGFGPQASGVLVSGGTVANLIGLATARNSLLPGVRQEGVGKGGAPRVYASREVHGWAARACDLLGLGSAALRLLPVDDRYRVDVAAVRAAIERDRARGEQPFCIIASVGTVATGAVDDLHALADLAAESSLWLHVDGAFGALLKLSHLHSGRVAGLERADSVAFDLHKWGYMQLELGVALVKDPAKHQAAFSFAPSYLATFEDGIGQNPTEFASRGLQLSRSFRALKAWMCLKTHGVREIGRAIDANIAQAQHLARLVEEAEDLELMAPADLNIVCLRYRPAGVTGDELDQLNRALLVELQTSGFAVPSNVELHGAFGLRVCITNHRTRQEDVERFVEELCRRGAARVGSSDGT